MTVVAERSQFHVLAVDDNLIDRKLIERLLKSSSYHVTAVDSGTKALEFLGLNGERYDIDCEEEDTDSIDTKPESYASCSEVEVNLVITDYCMPEMTGYDLLKKIKESAALKDVPVVIMSSENVPSRITRCLEEGAEEFLLKPVQLSDMDKLKPHLMKTNSKQSLPTDKMKSIVEILSTPSEKSRQRYDDGLVKKTPLSLQHCNDLLARQ